MAVSIFRGDLLKQNDVDAIVNTVNCVGVMGKGIALQFKNKWPGNYKIYRAACEACEVQIGAMLVFDCGGLVRPNYIINFPTKNHWRGKSEIEFIEKGLVDLINQVKRLGIKTIAVPPLGCGNGGLLWEQVRPLIEEAFAAVPDVEVRLFEPAGAPPPGERSVADIEKDIRALTPNERLDLLESLIRELGAAPERNVEKLWFVEAQRRYRELVEGKVNGVPGHLVFERLRSRLVG